MLSYKPQHINVSPQDIQGNEGIGRYIILTGSEQRAFDIAANFKEPKKNSHSRQYNFYQGKLQANRRDIDVAVISTGMGGPSADIIINELILLGAKRFLRIGTAGSLQPDTIRVGDIVIATGAVRDDKASWDYIYKEYPALSSIECIMAAKQVLAYSFKELRTHFGIVHSKSSLFAREFLVSSLPENASYMKSMHEAGVLASEMECAQLFILCSLMNARLKNDKKSANILCGGILAIIGDDTAFSADEIKTQTAIKQAIKFGLNIIKEMDLLEQG